MQEEFYVGWFFYVLFGVFSNWQYITYRKKTKGWITKHHLLILS